MSGFYSKCLIWGVDSDADSMKAISENPVKIWDVLSEMAFFDAEQSNAIEEYYPRRNEDGESLELVVGWEYPEKIVTFAKAMRTETSKAAVALTSAWQGDTLEAICKNVALDSTATYQLHCAMELLDNVPNSEAAQLFYNGYSWKCFPNDVELEHIMRNPEKCVVLNMLFC